MGVIDTIANNPLMKTVLFGQLKKVFKDGNVEFIVVRLDGAGEIMVDLYEKGEAEITVKFQKGGIIEND